MRSKGQMSIEFFVILGFVLVAAGVFIANGEAHAKGTRTLNNIALARNVLDSQVGAINYAYLSGPQSQITQNFFVPPGVSCMNWDDTTKQLYCIVGGYENRVNSEQIGNPQASLHTVSVDTANNNCYASGWITVKTLNEGGTPPNVKISCT